MGLCAKCRNHFWPKMMREVAGSEDKLCIFCKLDKEEIELLDEESKKKVILTKKGAIKSYDEFMRKMRDKPRVKELVKGK